VYCREKYSEPSYRGVSLIYLPTIRHKYLDTLAHTFYSTIHLLCHRSDVALYCNAANALFTIAPRAARIPVALNVDGIERKRKKWNAFARAWYRVSEYLATVFPNAVVSDAETIREYYVGRYGKATTFIPYGAETGKEPTDGTVRELGLEPGQYFLYVSRLEPENHALQVRCAFEKVPTTMKLAVVGDAPHAADYIARVRDTRDPRIVMPGGIYGLGYRELGSHCFAYVHATEVGGTHPALIEAMGRGALVIYRNTPENAEVCADAGLPFEDEAGLTTRMREVIAMSESSREVYRQRAVQRVKECYNWDVVTIQYEQLLARLSG
ncbi:MAG: glycosyl transferase, group 1, partial [Bryobacterales bacterium]|nr:glycosyl transferase, group 1 [Bryobacterales bacterium]